MARMRYVFCVLILVVSCSVVPPAYGQGQFVRAFGGNESDFGHSIIWISGGGFVITGRTESWTSPSQDILLSKFDASGEKVWTTTLGESGTGSCDDQANCVIETSDNRLVIVGKTESYGAGNYDLLLTQFSSGGSPWWTTTLGGAIWADEGFSVIQTTDDSLVVTGETMSFGAGGGDLLLAKFKDSGDHLWTKTLGGALYSDKGKSVIQASDGGFVVAGETSAYGAGSVDLLLAKFDVYGNHMWTRTLGGIASEFIFSVIETYGGDLVVTGFTNSYGAGNMDCLLAKFDGSGNHLWTKTLGGAETDYAYSGIETSDGGFVIAGYTMSFGGGGDFFLAKLDAGGNHVWTRVLGGDNQEGHSVVEIPDGSLVATGYTFDYGAGDHDLLLATFDTDGNTCMGTFVTPTVQNISPTIGIPSPTVTTSSPTIGSYAANYNNRDPDKTVVCPLPQCEVTPDNLDFGSVSIGDSLDLSFTITNTGDVGSTLTGVVTDSCDQDSIVTGGEPYSLDAGEYVTVTVRYKPTELGEHNCTVETGSPLCVDVACTGTGDEPPSCLHYPTSIDFGTVTVGESRQDTFYVTNTGGGILSGNIEIDCLYFSITEGEGAYNLAAEETLFVTVLYEPGETGHHVCTIANVCSDVYCEGTGGPPPVCHVEPTSLDFGVVYLGDLKDSTFTIKNLGGGTLTGSVKETCDAYIIVSGGAPVDSLLYSLTFGESLVVTVRFEPGSLGTHDCTVETGGGCTDVSCTGIAMAGSGEEIFVKTLGGNAYDYGGSVIQTSDGGFVAGGTTTSFGEGDRDNLLTKLDYFGNHLWTKAVGYGGNEGGIASVAEVSDGGLVVFGWSESFWADREHLIAKFDGSGNHLWSRTIRGTNPWWSYGGPVIETSDGGLVALGCTNSFTGVFDLFLAKFDSSGTHLWTKVLKGNNREMPGDLIETSNGKLVVAGYTMSFGAGDYDLLVAKLESSGDFIWAKTLGGVGVESGQSVTEALDGGLVVTGYTTSFGAGDDDLLIAKFNSSGSLLWTKTLGGAAADRGLSVVQTSDGALFVTGYTSSFGAGDSDLLFAKFSSSGDHLWSRTVGDTVADSGSSVIQTLDGRFVITGYTAGFGVGDRDLLLASFDSTGYNCLSQNVTPVVNSVSPDTAVASYTIQTQAPTITEPIPTVSSYVPDTTVVCDSHPTAVEGEPRESIPTISLEQNYPNPFNPTTTIGFVLPGRARATLIVYDVSGRLVRTLVNDVLGGGHKAYQWDGKDDRGNQVSTGVYFYRLTAGNRTLTKKMVLLK